jgi:hypothetical protein
MREQPRNPDEPPHLSANAQKLLGQVNGRISIMEAVLGNLHRVEASTGKKRKNDKADLRCKLNACYVAREGLKRGLHAEARGLTELLKRIEIQLTHRRFRVFGPITDEEIAHVDVDELGKRLQR